MTRFQPALIVASALVVGVTGFAGADEKQGAKLPAPLVPAKKATGVVDIEDVLSKNPFPADAKGPIHFTPIWRAKPPRLGAEYSVAGLHVRGELSLHRHRLRSEVVYVLAGTGSFFLGGETIALKPGLILHIPVGTPHGFKLDGDGRVFLVSIGKFDPKDLHHVKAAPTKATATTDPHTLGGLKVKDAAKRKSRTSPAKKSRTEPLDVVTPSTLD